jgi:hypothetical protein
MPTDMKMLLGVSWGSFVVRKREVVERDETLWED